MKTEKGYIETEKGNRWHWKTATLEFKNGNIVQIVSINKLVEQLGSQCWSLPSEIQLMMEDVDTILTPCGGGFNVTHIQWYYDPYRPLKHQFFAVGGRPIYEYNNNKEVLICETNYAQLIYIR